MKGRHNTPEGQICGQNKQKTDILQSSAFMSYHFSDFMYSALFSPLEDNSLNVCGYSATIRLHECFDFPPHLYFEQK